MREWNVGLSAWVIQDGNYGDFHCHQKAKFALEFYPHDFQRTSATEKMADCIGGSRYRVNAQVVCVLADVWVVDFGLSAFQQAKPPHGTREGDWIAADIDLGIDPFFYFEELAHVQGMPPLIYEWIVREILMQTAPFVETRDHRGTRFLVRDESKSAYRQIEQTNAWTDDNGLAEYILRSELLGTPPMRTQN
jgi:hypothetical protein